MLATLSRPCSSLAMDCYAAAANSESIFLNFKCLVGPQDLSYHPLLLDKFPLGPPSCVLGWVFCFLSKCLLRNTLANSVSFCFGFICRKLVQERKLYSLRLLRPIKKNYMRFCSGHGDKFDKT